MRSNHRGAIQRTLYRHVVKLQKVWLTSFFWLLFAQLQYKIWLSLLTTFFPVTFLVLMDVLYSVQEST